MRGDKPLDFLFINMQAPSYEREKESKSDKRNLQKRFFRWIVIRYYIVVTFSICTTENMDDLNTIFHHMNKNEVSAHFWENSVDTQYRDVNLFCSTLRLLLFMMILLVFSDTRKLTKRLRSICKLMLFLICGK